MANSYIQAHAADAPYLDCAYKLVEYAGKPSRKRSEGKATWPGSADGVTAAQTESGLYKVHGLCVLPTEVVTDNAACY